MSYQPYVCMQTHSTCYNGTTHPMQIKGILWHSTGANNPNLKRYVQPYKGDPNYDEAIAKLGYNSAQNDWNHIKRDAGLNAWIGKFADGTVGTVQTMPWDYKPWGCGSGSKGSCNNGWIQFEICEDGLNDKNYAQQVWDEAIKFTVYICQMFNLNPLGTTSCGSATSVPVITCHNDAAKLGVGCNHADINHWFPKLLGKNMENARQEVAAILGGSIPTPAPVPQPPTPTPTPSTYPTVPFLVEVTAAGLPILKSAGGASSGKTIAKGTYTIVEVSGDYGKLKSGAGWIQLNTNKTKIAENIATNPPQTSTPSVQPAPAKSNIVKVTVPALNVRKGPGTKYGIITIIRDKGTYTIVEEQNGWGLLKAYQNKRNGWIALQYTKKV